MQYTGAHCNLTITSFIPQVPLQITKHSPPVDTSSHCWQTLTDQPIRQYVVDGDHYTMLHDKNNAVLAEILNQLLA